MEDLVKCPGGDDELLDESYLERGIYKALAPSCP
jgi:hypothetical protein